MKLSKAASPEGLRGGVLGVLVLLSAIAAPRAQTPSDIVIHAADAIEVRGTWQKVADTTAASNARFWQPNANAAKIPLPLAAPQHYFDVQFRAESGRAYRLWVRSRADANNWVNDSFFVQFSGSVDHGHSRGVFRVSFQRLGLAGQRIRKSRARRRDPLRPVGPADRARPGA